MPEEERPDLAKKAIQVIVVGGSAASVAFASGAGPGVVLAAGAAASSSQASDLVSGVWGSLRERWNRNGQATLEAGADAAGMDLEEFLERLRSSPARHELLAAALEGGAHAELEAKIATLGRALARGALADEPQAVDVERLFVQAMADFETSHIRLLDLIAAAEFRTPPLVTTQELTELPWLPRFAVFPILAALQRHLAVYPVGVGSVSVHNPDAGGGVVWGGQGIPGRWGATPFGFTCLDRLREAGWEQEGSAE